MKKLDIEKLKVIFKEGVTETAPIIPRRYTLTTVDISKNFYLLIGPDFFLDNVTSMQDFFLGEWIIMEHGIRYYLFVHMNRTWESEMERASINSIRSYLPLVLQVIRYGDRRFFEMIPEMDYNPIIVYYLYNNPEYNKAENLGSFGDYRISTTINQVIDYSIMEHHVLIDEDVGDVNGDGIPDRVFIYGDKSRGLDDIHNISIEVDYGRSEIGVQIITELNGYNPTLFLGDFTKDKTNDILFSMDTQYSSLNQKEKGRYGIGIYTKEDKGFVTIFDSGRYNEEYQYIVEYNDFYRVSIFSVRNNRLFYLDIRHKGDDYLSQYYSKEGKLIRPILGKVLSLEKCIPIVNNLKDKSFDLLAIQRIIGSSDNDTLGYINNLLSWDGKQFANINMMVSATGTYLIPLN